MSKLYASINAFSNAMLNWSGFSGLSRLLQYACLNVRMIGRGCPLDLSTGLCPSSLESAKRVPISKSLTPSM